MPIRKLKLPVASKNGNPLIRGNILLVNPYILTADHNHLWDINSLTSSAYIEVKFIELDVNALKYRISKWRQRHFALAYANEKEYGDSIGSSRPHSADEILRTTIDLVASFPNGATVQLPGKWDQLIRIREAGQRTDIYGFENEITPYCSCESCSKKRAFISSFEVNGLNAHLNLVGIEGNNQEEVHFRICMQHFSQYTECNCSICQRLLKIAGQKEYIAPDIPCLR